jgi:hypothetical protein
VPEAALVVPVLEFTVPFIHSENVEDETTDENTNGVAELTESEVVEKSALT